jgi:hypothetical protein
MRHKGFKDHKMSKIPSITMCFVSITCRMLNVKSRQVNLDCIAGEGRFWIVVGDTNTYLLGRTLGPAYSGQPTELEVTSKG